MTGSTPAARFAAPRPARPAARPLVSAIAVAAALVAAQSARAEVTAQQVWDDYKAQLGQYGQPGLTIGSESLAGGVLTATDVVFENVDAQGGSFRISFPSIVLTENGDGSVAIVSSDSYPIAVTTPADPAAMTEESVILVTVSQTDAVTTARGDPGAITYDTTAASLAASLDSVTQGGVELPVEATLTLADVSTTTTTTTAEMRSSAFDMGAGSIDLSLDVTDPETAATVAVTGTIADLSARGVSSMPLDAMASPETAMLNGLTFEGGYAYGAADYAFEVNDATTGPTSGTVAIAGGGLSLSASEGAIGYDSMANGLALQVTSAAMPFPVNAQIAEYGATLLIPTAQSETPSDWAFGLNVTDLVLNEEVWALFDPQAMLPRDPATVVMDLSGTATLFYDVMDPAQQQANAATAPGEINSVSIDDLTISIGGAQVTGTGAFTLDNTDLTTFAGIPRPEGSADFQLNGVNGLIDTLVAMGIIPEAQVAGARMMLGLLAVPVGDDQLTSRIEVTPEGALLANGQRLQ